MQDRVGEFLARTLGKAGVLLRRRARAQDVRVNGALTCLPIAGACALGVDLLVWVLVLPPLLHRKPAGDAFPDEGRRQKAERRVIAEDIAARVANDL